MLSQWRRHSRWRMFLVLLAFVGLIPHNEATVSADVPESASSTPAVKRKTQDIGSLSDFTWQAWLLVDTQTGSQPGMDSATLLRRITPKSVFIAPALPACADGYRADNMNRCVKSVNIDENAHFSFLLQRLNALYANQDGNSRGTGSKNEQKQSSGPLQLNIPLIPDSDSQSSKIELAETFSMNDPIAVLPDEVHLEEDHKRTKPQRAEVTVYEVKNDTASDDEKETTTFLGNSNTRDVDKADQKFDTVVPVAEFVEETNDTSFSGVVDYKIPIDLKTLLNVSGMKRLNVSNIRGEGSVPIADRRENSTEMSPTLVLLLSPTKLPSEFSGPETDNLSSTRDGTNVANNHVTAHMSNLTSNATTKETIGVSMPDSYEFSSTWKLSEDPLNAADKQRANETYAEDESATESFRLNESHESEFVYDEEEEDEEYPYSTDMPDEESAEDGEEILKHGEAGITIPTEKIERLHRDQQRLQQQQQLNETTDGTKTPDIRNQVMIRFNDSTSADKDEAGSNVSSEVSIDGDLILETTLLDVNTEKLQVTTKSPKTREATRNNDNDTKKISFDEDNGSAPEVVFSPQDTHGTVSTSLHGRKQTENPARVETRAENERNEELETAPSSSESFLYDPPEEDPTTGPFHTTDERQSAATESAFEEDSRDSGLALHRTFESDVPVSNFKRISMNLGPAEDYVRFPDYMSQPQQGYVRFPTSEANSIHGQSYKQHSHYTAEDVSYGSTSTKSSVPVRQKPIYHLTTSWKSNRQQPTDHVATMIARKQKQTPVLLRFWNKMPLVRDPDVYPADSFSTIQSDEPNAHEERRDRSLRRSSSRRVRSYTGISPQNVRVLTRKRRRTSPLRG